MKCGAPQRKIWFSFFTQKNSQVTWEVAHGTVVSPSGTASLDLLQSAVIACTPVIHLSGSGIVVPDPALLGVPLFAWAWMMASPASPLELSMMKEAEEKTGQTHKQKHQQEQGTQRTRDKETG